MNFAPRYLFDVPSQKMSQDTLEDPMAQEYANISFSLKLLIVAPDYLNLVFLSIGQYGMYQGIEILHPLYSVLFMNLITSWLSSLINVAVFPFTQTLDQVKLTNAGSALVLFFHSVCWLMTCIVRHLYIVNDVWLHSKVQSAKVQSKIAIISVIVLTTALAFPCFAYLRHLGKYYSCLEQELKILDRLLIRNYK